MLPAGSCNQICAAKGLTIGLDRLETALERKVRHLRRGVGRIYHQIFILIVNTSSGFLLSGLRRKVALIQGCRLLKALEMHTNWRGDLKTV